jgi:hypothetical protein
VMHDYSTLLLRSSELQLFEGSRGVIGLELCVVQLL